MLFKRAITKLGARDWGTIAIELLIVVIGVFVATQVSNWNQRRIEAAETRQMLLRLRPEISNVLANYRASRTYYEHVRGYATTAFAGWRGDPRVSDPDFVVAAYQASQIYSNGMNNGTWATIFGADRLRTIEDEVIRSNLAYLMYADTTPINTVAVDTPYRQNVRRIIREDVQDAIRDRCGDHRPPDNPQLFELPATCDLVIPPAVAAETAAALRAHPELAEDLRWKTAAAAAYLANIAAFETRAKSLAQRIEEANITAAK